MGTYLITARDVAQQKRLNMKLKIVYCTNIVKLCFNLLRQRVLQFILVRLTTSENQASVRSSNLAYRLAV